MKSYNEKVKLRYLMLAKVYDLTDVFCFPIKRRNPRLGLADNIPNESISVLDVCTGTGNGAISIAAKNDKNKVLGLDLTEQMLKVAQNKIRRKKLLNMSLLCMDATNIALEEKFDIVTTSLSLHEMPGEVRDLVISEMSRVLRKGGRMYIIEWDKPSTMPWSALFMLFPYQCEPNGFGSFLKLDWNHYLSRYGLKLERIERYTFSKLIIASKE